MGTNYYVQPDDNNEELHLGKSGSGWVFSLRVYPERGINDLIDWTGEWEKGEISDQYGNKLSKDEMMRIITARRVGELRHPIDGKRCIGHGDGPYDFMAEDFS